jgi:hypothetical protein
VLLPLLPELQVQIQRLQSKIEDQEQEIAKLKTMIALLSVERDYDC